MQFLPPLFLLAALLLPALRARWRRPAALLLAAFVLVQLPWQLRNLTMPKGPPQPSLAISFLHHGSYPDFKYQGRDDTYGYPYRFDPDNDRVTRDLPSVLRNIAHNFRTDPWRQARWHLVGKPLQFIAWDIVNGFGDVYTYPPVRSPYLDDLRFALSRVFMLEIHLPLMLLGLASALVAAWRPRLLGISPEAEGPARLAAAVLLYAVAFHMIGAPFPRYGIPFRALFYMFALLPFAALGLALARPRTNAAA